MEKKPSKAKVERTKEDPEASKPETTGSGDAGQKTLLITPPSRFEEVVDAVLKKHKL